MTKNIWELNTDLSNATHEIFEGSHVWYVDDFYKYPDLVLDEITLKEPPIWKVEDKDTYNKIYFEDRRHMIFHKELEEVYDKISNLIRDKDPGRESSSDYGLLTTNHTLFYSDEKSLKFNDYKTKWWWPHIDGGYNGICYLDKEADGEIGTNLYRRSKTDPLYYECAEHYRPWIEFEYWERIAAFTSKYNRFVLFDGRKYFHGMNIEDDRYFKKFRVNQVFFFKDEDFEDPDFGDEED